MITKLGLKMDKNAKIGAGREYLVSQFIKMRWKWEVEPSNFVDDVHNEIDLIARGKTGKAYIQVKGFHDNWREQEFDKLVAKAKQDYAKAYAMFVNSEGRIYCRRLI